jgi:large subunit ribosomal protein L25
MQQTIKLNAEPRSETGKCAVRRLRNTGRIPAVAYGRGLATKQISVSPKDVVAVLGTERGRNSVIELDVQGQKSTVLLAQYQYHPLTRALLHADFREIKENELLDVDVPFETTGKPKGVIAGGVLRLVFRKLPVRCLPANVPVKLSHDVTELEIDDTVAVKALALPEGVTIRLPPELTVVAVVTEKKQVEEEVVPGAAGAAGAVPGAAAAAPGAAGAAGAPAGAAAAPAAGAAPGGKAGAGAPAGGKGGGKPNK